MPGTLSPVTALCSTTAALLQQQRPDLAKSAYSWITQSEAS
jgi:hypothetical protein